MLTPLALLAVVLFATVAPGEAPEAAVGALVEDLRKAELVLDTDSLESFLAYSFTVLEDGTRLSGSFAYLEPLRRLKGRRGTVKELRYEQLAIRVYGASAVASYIYRKTWVDEGVRRQRQGWCSDVFEKRDDGLWLLVHRHRP